MMMSFCLSGSRSGKTHRVVFLSVALIAAFLLKPASCWAGKCQDTYKKVAFSDLERAYILAGKARHIEKEVRKAAQWLNRQGKAVDLGQLLDASDSNYEFHGFWIDESSKINPRVELYVRAPDGEMLTLRYGGMELVDGCFIQTESKQMLRVIKQGLQMAATYDGYKDKKGQFLRALDAQAGKLDDVAMSFTPKFQKLMGFSSEKEMRQILQKTTRIKILYSPNPEDSSPWVETDLLVIFYLRNGSQVEKYVGDVPLSILK